MLSLFSKGIEDRARHQSFVLLLLSVTLSNSTPIFSKLLYSGGWTPMSTYFLALVIMTIVLAAHEFISLKQGERWKMDRHDFWGTVATTCTSGIVAPLLFFIGLQYVRASDAVLLTSLLPLFTVVFAVLFLGERFTFPTLIGGSLLLAGLGVLLWRDVASAQLTIGSMLLIASSCIGALTTIVHKKFVKHRHLDSIVFVRTFWSMLVFAILIGIFEPSSFQLFLEPQNLLLVLGLPILSYLLPFFLFFRALDHIKAMEAGFISVVGPIAGVLFAAGFLGEKIGPFQVMSLLLVIFGVVFINVPLTKWRIVPSRLPTAGPLRK